MKYALLRQIGYGPIGRVYVAKGGDGAALFAGKRLHGELCTAAEIAALQEAVALAREVQHAAIVRPLDCETAEETVVVISELDAGESLATLSEGDGRARWLGDEDARLRCICQVAEGLSAWHETGLTHGNIKPSNIRVGGVADGADFRLADTIYGDLYTTRQLMRRSSRDAAYAAPEQFDGAISLRSDVYSFAMVSLYVLAGKTLFAPESLESIIQQKRQGALAVNEQLMELAPGLRRVFGVALAEDSASRFGSVREFTQGLEEAIAEDASARDDAAGQGQQHMTSGALSRRRLVQVGMSLTGFVGAFGVAGLGRSLLRGGGSASKGAPNGPVLQLSRFVAAGILAGHTGKVNSLSWSPDGTSLASAANDATVHLWQPGAATTKGGALYQGAGAANCAIFSPDGGRLAIGLSGGGLMVLHANGTQPQQVLQSAGSTIRAVAWSLDGAEVVSASADGMVRVWSLGGGEMRLAIMASSGEARAVAFLPNDRIISVGTDGALSVWDATSGDPVMSVVGGSSLSALALSPDMSEVVVGGAESVSRIWRTSRLAVVFNLPQQHGAIRSLAWGHGGIASGSDVGGVLVDDPSTPANGIASITTGNGVWAVAWSPDGRTLAVGTADGAIQLWKPV